MRRINPNYDPDNSLYDRESDENFEIEDDDDEEEDIESDDGDDEEYYGGSFKPRRENYHA